MIYWLFLPVAGGVGALGRYKTEAFLVRTFAKRGLMPDRESKSLVNLASQAWPILIVNIIGSFTAGLLVGPLAARPGLWLVLGTGFLGGWTTFSTALMDVLTISSNPRYAQPIRIITALATAFGTMLICMFAALGGLALTM